MSVCHKNNRSWVIRSLIFLVVAVILCSCSHVCPINATLDKPPDIKKIPLTVGVFYNNEFRNYEHSRATMQHRWVVPIGQASVSLLDFAFPILFERVVNLSSRPPYQQEKEKVVAVIEPSIEDFNFSIPFAFGDYSTEVVYRFTLYSLDGTPFASWMVTGEGKRKAGFGYATHATPIGEATSIAMQDAVKKFLSGFSQVPEVKAWLRRVEPVKTE